MIRTLLSYFFVSIIICNITACKAQKATLEKVVETFQGGNTELALEQINKVLKKEPTLFKAHILQGEIYEKLKNSTAGITSYENAIAISPQEYAPVYNTLAKLYLNTGNYEKASQVLDTYLSFPNLKPEGKNLANKRQQQANFGKQELDKNAAITFEPLSTINSLYREDGVQLNADESILIYSLTNMDKKPYQEDFYSSKKENGIWQTPTPIASLNDAENKGALTLSADGRYMVFSYCPEGSRCDLYSSSYEDGTWQEKQKLSDTINTPYTETQPSLSADGNTLYFVSNRPGGVGKADIWYSTKNKEKNWQMPINIGSPINTPENDITPYIHKDNTTLYYATNGLLGMGGMDLFKTQRKTANTWDIPTNMGYPINTYKDEMGIYVTTDGKKAYITSDRQATNSTTNNQSEYKNMDIYTINLPTALQPTTTKTFQVVLKDAITKQPINGNLQVVNSSNKDKQIFDNTAIKKFWLCLPTNNSYLLNATSKGYFLYSDNKYITDTTTTITLLLHKIAKQQEIILKNVFFSTDSYILEELSTIELDKLVFFLQQNPTLTIQLQGHTDNVGTATKNQELSTQRAKIVYDYLIKKGIEATKLTYKGYGSTKPIANNTTPDGKASNRRTSFYIP